MLNAGLVKKMKKLGLLVSAIFLSVAMVPGCINSEKESSIEICTITGIVLGENLDGTMMPIENATISIQNTKFIVNTNSTGGYEIKNLPPGNYAISANLDGYEPETKNISLDPDAEKNENFYLYPKWWGNRTEVMILETNNTVSRVNILGTLVGLDSEPGIPVKVPEGTRHIYATLDWIDAPPQGTTIDLRLVWKDADSKWYNNGVESSDPCTPLNKPYTYNITVNKCGDWEFFIDPDAVVIDAGVCINSVAHLKIDVSRA